MLQFSINNREFELFRAFIYEQAGIRLNDEKKALVTSRLSKRLRHLNLESFQEYYDLIVDKTQSKEKQAAVDLLTTNETYFFREPKHFAYLEQKVLPMVNGPGAFRVWSAASSTGEEAYSLAMVLDENLGSKPWEVFGSDISSRVIEKASSGHYSLDRTDGIPKAYLRRYCLKGTQEYDGTLLIHRSIRSRVVFDQVNLQKPLSHLGKFNLVFLRNVMIYFDDDTKRKIVDQIIDVMKPGGLLFIGHSESITGMNSRLKSVVPTIYQKN